ncbi:putative PIG3 family NAD(P)H quinone oxidoreductase [Hasllibacter halocynthiae]|uniref:Putative PIG3 family NAD(P)H quinone oxidoreductase n=1 Tax=Hasllibacter halocynthiae TaxID=595589 RepID=A0A2T0X408_9RHOB|nr:NAD(P)H-quinone oxidoreductase [Hasllibacter halocynthiae]PRY93670.1 putative PIG3 family NAD(P)H quinone oxidoreductase [Hasllibacter halocynthiae]
MTLPDTMRAVEIARPGGPDVLAEVARPVPRPGAGEVLVRLAHAGVNRPDALQRAGAYEPPPGASDLPGLEGAGTVAALGADVSGWSEGDRICALLPGGGYAEYALAPAAHCLPVPDDLPLAEAACLPETLFTTFSNLVMRASLSAGETLLVHGGSSGIGTTAIQLARLLGARVVVTAGTDAKCQACEALGADMAVNYRDRDFVHAVEELGGADVILDMVGGDYLPRNLSCLREDGRLVQIAFLRGARAEVNLAPLMARRQTITGSTLRPRSVEAKAAIRDRILAEVWPDVVAGRLRPVMDSAFPLARAAEAHARMEASGHIGKIVLNVGA